MVTEKEMLKVSVEEFDRIQDYMMSCEKDSEVYKKISQRLHTDFTWTSTRFLCLPHQEKRNFPQKRR